MGMQNDAATLEDSLAVSHKAKYTFTICRLKKNAQPKS